MNAWMMNGVVFDVDALNELKGAIGFVYVITNPDGMMYVGKKQFHFKKTLPPLKGKKNKRHSMIMSDWLTYHGSSDKLNKMIELHGKDKFQREILSIHYSKGDLSYAELKEQVDRDVLRDSRYLNGIIQVRIGANHLMK